jgi:hypothetical protein
VTISRAAVLAWLRPVLALSHNTITLTGAVLTTSSALTMIGFWLLEVLQLRTVHPYAGMILFLALPAIFVLGLLLMPLGVLLRRRRLRRTGESLIAWRLDLADGFVRRAIAWVTLATGVNVVLLSTAAYQGVVYMDSTRFCGLTCHSVMAPEYTAYLDSPHSRVACTECHIGPGAPWFVRAKISGTRQLFAVALGTHSRPIPSPVKHLRPSRETCEECHWPQKFHGDKLLVRTKYDSDETNTARTTVLVLKVGGRTSNGGVGIHGHHLDPPERIRYVATDEHRQVIPQVTYRGDDGQGVVFSSSETQPTPDSLAKGEHRTMDCLDCHNRPSHTFEMPERAVDRALSEGRINRELPFIKKKGVELLRTDYPDRTTAATRIVQDLGEYYRASYPDVYRKQRTAVEVAAAQLKAIYERNVFPGMKVTWGTYPNNIGHDDFLGCFRCHDEQHKAPSGRTISQDCTACHTLLAVEETNPKILADLDMKPATP